MMGEVYPPDYQRAWQEGRLWQLSIAQAQMNSNGSSQTPSAVHFFPPVLAAAAWQAQVHTTMIAVALVRRTSLGTRVSRDV